MGDLRRINAAHMQNFLGKDVVFLGQYLNMDHNANGTNLKLKACDDPIILCIIKPPIQSYIAEGSYIEVEGRVASRSTINVTKYTIFDENQSKNFDRKTYCEAIQLLLGIGMDNNYIITDVTEHHGHGEEAELLHSDTKQAGGSGGNEFQESFMAM